MWCTCIQYRHVCTHLSQTCTCMHKGTLLLICTEEPLYCGCPYVHKLVFWDVLSSCSVCTERSRALYPILCSPSAQMGLEYSLIIDITSCTQSVCARVYVYYYIYTTYGIASLGLHKVLRFCFQLNLCLVDSKIYVLHSHIMCQNSGLFLDNRGLIPWIQITAQLHNTQ